MSEFPEIQTNKLDKPAHEFLPGDLSKMQNVLFDALDNGVLAKRTLEEAARVGNATLEAYARQESSWLVYAEMGPDICVARQDGDRLLEPHAQYPTNIYGEIQEVATGHHPASGRDMLYVRVESYAIGQYDNYIVPIAYAGDTSLVVKAGDNRDRRIMRVTDMPMFARESYVKRLTKKERAVARAFVDFLDDSPKTAQAVTAYLQERLKETKHEGVRRYGMGINLMLEDMYYGGEPLRIQAADCEAYIEYDHEGEYEAGDYTDLYDEPGELLGVNLVYDEQGVLCPEWLVQLHGGDLVVTLKGNDDFLLSMGGSSAE